MYRPTKKFVAAAVSGLALILIHFVASGEWNATEWGEVATLVTALSAAYAKSNDQTPGGVPHKKA